MTIQAEVAVRPLLHPSELSQWLPTLGEKALLAWIQFHSWIPAEEEEQTSFLIPNSLNKIIKKLKTGKHTFYQKILRPLLDFGLVHLKPAPHSKQELHLVVHSSPIHSDIPDHKELKKTDEPLFEDRVNVESTTAEQPIVTTSEPSLPASIENAISQDPKLIKRKSGIIKVFQQCKSHPRYSEQAFLRKMLFCINYNHGNFGSYLLRSILNEWDKPIPIQARPHPRSTSIPVLQPSCPTGIPPWVWEQQRNQELGHFSKQPALTPEQQALSKELFRQLEMTPS